MPKPQPYEWFSYEVWDHGYLDAPEITGLSFELPLGYWILEIDDEAKVSGVCHWRARFRFEEYRRLTHGPMLSRDDWDREKRAPSPSIGFADFPSLPFDRQMSILSQFNELRQEWVYDWTPRESEPEDADPISESQTLQQLQQDLTELEERVRQMDEWWTLKYRVTGQYCAYLRSRKWFPWVR